MDGWMDLDAHFRNKSVTKPYSVKKYHVFILPVTKAPRGGVTMWLSPFETGLCAELVFVVGLV